MNYVQELRAYVGHRPLILAAAGVLVLNEHGHLLLQRRADDSLWGIPGGSMELDESTEDTARRELYEETGLQVGKMTLFGVFSGMDMYHVYPNGDEVAIVSIVYVTSDVKGELNNSNDESLELQYFSPEALQIVHLSSPNKPIIRRFLQTFPYE